MILWEKSCSTHHAVLTYDTTSQDDDCMKEAQQRKAQRIFSLHRLELSISQSGCCCDHIIKRSCGLCSGVSVKGDFLPQMLSGLIKLLSVEFEDQINFSDFSVLWALPKKLMRGPLLTCSCSNRCYHVMGVTVDSQVCIVSSASMVCLRFCRLWMGWHHPLLKWIVGCRLCVAMTLMFPSRSRKFSTFDASTYVSARHLLDSKQPMVAQ